jgi:hypothetical protein
VIVVNGETLPEWEERIIREELVGGWRVPAEAECDGCSGGCPDSWPKWRPREERIFTRAGCVVHDFERRYEGGRFRSFWHRAAARWDADGRLRLNWRRLPEIEPYRSRFAAWKWWERWLYFLLTSVGYRALRLAGWIVGTDVFSGIALLVATAAACWWTYLATRELP